MKAIYWYLQSVFWRLFDYLLKALVAGFVGVAGLVVLMIFVSIALVFIRAL